LLERRDWHIADKLDVRFHGTFGKKLTSVCVADSLFAPDWRFAASRHPLRKCGAVFCCVRARNAHEHWLFARLGANLCRVNVAPSLRSSPASFSTARFIETNSRRVPII
jgi:hypothetical protein